MVQKCSRSDVSRVYHRVRSVAILDALALVLKPLKQSPPNKRVAVLWNVLLVLCPLFLGACVSTELFDSKIDEENTKLRELF